MVFFVEVVDVDFAVVVFLLGVVEVADFVVVNKLQSVFVPGLYICGELLDVDGKCGGYNLQWAWTSGAIAGVYAAR